METTSKQVAAFELSDVAKAKMGVLTIKRNYFASIVFNHRDEETKVVNFNFPIDETFDYKKGMRTMYKAVATLMNELGVEGWYVDLFKSVIRRDNTLIAVTEQDQDTMNKVATGAYRCIVLQQYGNTGIGKAEFPMLASGICLNEFLENCINIEHFDEVTGVNIDLDRERDYEEYDEDLEMFVANRNLLPAWASDEIANDILYSLNLYE